MDVKELLSEKIVPSVLSGLGGAAAWGWKTFSGIQKQLREARQDLAALKEAFDEAREREERRDRADQTARRVQAKLADRVLVLEQRINAHEVDIKGNSEAFQKYAREQVDQWNDVTRSLGFLEGKLQGDPVSKGRKT